MTAGERSRAAQIPTQSIMRSNCCFMLLSFTGLLNGSRSQLYHLSVSAVMFGQGLSRTQLQRCILTGLSQSEYRILPVYDEASGIIGWGFLERENFPTV